MLLINLILAPFPQLGRGDNTILLRATVKHDNLNALLDHQIKRAIGQE